MQNRNEVSLANEGKFKCFVHSFVSVILILNSTVLEMMFAECGLPYKVGSIVGGRVGKAVGSSVGLCAKMIKQLLQKQAQYNQKY